jgi:hypothetical protein
LILLVIIALAGTGLALAASQASLPGQALYPLKLWSEDLRLNLAYYSPAGWQLALEFSDQRIREIEAVSQSGGMPPASLLLRLENQSDQAISSALRLDQDQAITAMRMIQERMQSQYLTIEQLQRASPNQPQMEQTLSSVREMIQLRLRQIEQRLQNPAFYNQPSLQVSAQVSPGGALPQPSNVNPVSTPIPGNIPMTTALPAGCISCPVNGTLSPSTAVPGGNQPTQAGSPNPQTTAGSQPNQPGSPLTGENQPGSPPEDSGNPPEKPERPGPGGYRKR